MLAITPELAALSAAFVIGFFGGAHCVGMCGGIMSALSFSIPEDQPRRRWTILITYNIGRIASYAFIGLLAGLLGAQFSGGHGLGIMRVIAGGLLVAMGLYLASWWRGLQYLERAGGLLWKRIQPLGSGLIPVRSLSSALTLGMIWGWLPCGLVYTALAYAMAQAEGAAAALVMLAFGLGTLPAVLATGLFADGVKTAMQHQGLRSVVGSLIIVFGVWTIWGTLGHSGHHHNQGHDHQGHGQHGAHEQHFPNEQHEGHNVQPAESAIEGAEEGEAQAEGMDAHHHHHHH